MNDQAAEPGPRRRRRRLRIVLPALLLAMLAAAGIAWLQRFAIADSLIRSALAKRGVRANYAIEKIGFRTQRLTNLVIGDPRAPDLTARRIDVVISLFDGATVKRIEATGVRVRGRWTGSRLSLGDLDRFGDPQASAPLALPDIAVTLADVGARIDTPWGALGLTLAGDGNLKDGFRGKLSAASPRIATGGCLVVDPSFLGTVAIEDGRPRLAGPVRVARAECAAGTALGASAAGIDVTLGRGFDRWAGRATLVLGAARAGGWQAGGASGTIAFQGDARATRLDGDVTAQQIAGPRLRVAALTFRGKGQAASVPSLSGRLSLREASLPAALREGFAARAGTTSGLPVEPVARHLAAALDRAAQRFDGAGGIELTLGPTRLLRVAGVSATALSGARVALADPIVLRDAGKGWQVAPAGAIRIGGGGLPDAALRLREMPGGFGGQLVLDRVDAPGGSLAIPGLQFVARDGGAAFTGRALLSGPMAGGRVADLSLPLDGTIDPAGRFTLWDGCRTLAAAALDVAGVSLSRPRLSLCPEERTIVRGGGGRPLRIAALLPAIALRGRAGDSPLAVAARQGRFGGDGRFALSDARVTLGAGSAVTRLSLASLTGASVRGGLAGRLNGASGAIANVPLEIGDADGDWTWRDGALALRAALTVTDQAQVDRFRPMRVRDVTLGFTGDRIAAAGTLREADSGRAVTRVAITHSLSGGTGHADLAVDGLSFGPDFQPTAITPLALGVVANVEGAVSGSGRIDWSPDGVTSSGTFTTTAMDLAAAFGPVERLSGTIRFDDLLALSTAPGQELRIGSVNPGIAVFDGVLRYRLLPGQRVRVEGGRWPLAGGELVLEPTTLDLGQDRPRALTFVVTGLDAAQFLQQFGFDNLQTTGIFDGRLPIVFDSEGGHIRGGGLISREGGGIVAYVGELSYKDLGTFGNYAFQALKSIRYRRLEIGMDGDLGGEIVTQVNFAGLQQGEGAARNIVTRQLAKLPIQFNVTIRAPFMQLVGSVRGYYNPELLVGQNLRTLLDAQRGADPKRPAVSPAVQPAESEVRP